MQYSSWSTVSNSKLYLKAAEELRRDPNQWAAYESTGNCVVVAGPGSGKTKTLTIKLARLLSEDITPPRGVACITYSNECARELEHRLEDLGIEAGRRVFIGTVHSFSMTQIILPYAQAAQLGLPEEFKIASRIERAGALERAYRRTINGPENPQRKDFSMSNYRRSILDRTSDAWRTRDPEMASFVEAFEEELRAISCIDFDDMPLLALKALNDNEWLRHALYAKYPTLIIDEYQDLGKALHHIVMSLCFNGKTRLFAVGDTDQSIYGFTGAHPELLNDITLREDVETHRLRFNYRCASRIVTASCYALGEARDYQAIEGAEDGTIFFHPQTGIYEHHAEDLFSTIIPDIIARHPAIRLDDIAILYPAAWIGDTVYEASIKHDFPTIRTDKNSLYPRSNRILRWLEQCAEWCCGGWSTGKPRFSSLYNTGKLLFFESLNTEESQILFQNEFISTLWNLRDANASLNLWLTTIVNDLIASHISTCRSLRDEFSVLESFIAQTSCGESCEDMTLGQFSGQGAGSNCINLSTLHSSKGREFKAVIMFGMDNGRIPRSQAPRTVLEARRLFYVGFTRAETELHLIYSAQSPSPFVLEVQRRIEEETTFT